MIVFACLFISWALRQLGAQSSGLSVRNYTHPGIAPSHGNVNCFELAMELPSRLLYPFHRW